MAKNTQVLLKRQSSGVPVTDDFELVSDDIDQKGPGDLLCETLYLSLDPYLRGRISGRHLTGAINPGDVMAGEAVSRVLESSVEQFPAGAIIAAHSGWQSHPIVDATTARLVNPSLGPISTTIGDFGNAWPDRLRRLTPPRRTDGRRRRSGVGGLGTGGFDGRSNREDQRLYRDRNCGI